MSTHVEAGPFEVGGKIVFHVERQGFVTGAEAERAARQLGFDSLKQAEHAMREVLLRTPLRSAPRARGAGRPAGRTKSSSSTSKSAKDPPGELPPPPCYPRRHPVSWSRLVVDPPVLRPAAQLDFADLVGVLVCERCGVLSSRREVNWSDQTCAWTCLRCYLSEVAS